MLRRCEGLQQKHPKMRHEVASHTIIRIVKKNFHNNRQLAHSDNTKSLSVEIRPTWPDSQPQTRFNEQGRASKCADYNIQHRRRIPKVLRPWLPKDCAWHY